MCFFEERIKGSNLPSGLGIENRLTAMQGVSCLWWMKMDMRGMRLGRSKSAEFGRTAKPINKTRERKSERINNPQ